MRAVISGSGNVARMLPTSSISWAAKWALTICVYASQTPLRAIRRTRLEQIAYVNGSFVPMADAKVSILDRGFLFADGIYESPRCWMAN